MIGLKQQKKLKERKKERGHLRIEIGIEEKFCCHIKKLIKIVQEIIIYCPNRIEIQSATG
uniref:Uncharacterized protein n=1 Tax=Onchocerca volvulus TaxID=6282 RepID=A0A8R1Y0V2_ONCVO